MTTPSVETVSHRFLGAMRRLTVAPGVFFDLTLEEASTLSRALAAVGRDHKRVEEIYLSPNASDREFLARVTDDGLLVTGVDGGFLLAWAGVAALAEILPAQAG